MITILLATNIITIILLNKDDHVLLDHAEEINIKDPVASVNGKNIYYKDWMHMLTSDYGKQSLQHLIDHAVVAQLAEEKEVFIHEKLIDQGVSLLATMQGVMTAEEYAVLEERWRKDLLHQHQLKELLTEDEYVSEMEIKSHYNQYRDQYDFTASMQLSHIVVEDLEIAKKVVRELDEGALFHMLAAEYSIDKETKDTGGYLGYLTKTSQFLPAGYYDEAINLKEDSYSDPFQTDQGFSVIYLHRQLQSITFTYEEIADEIRRELALQKTGQILTVEQLSDNLDVKWIYD